MNPLSLPLRRSIKNTTTPAEAFYGLDHAVLNIPLPPPSMWMNLGYWKDTNDFPIACAALLDQVLITAGLLDEDDIGRVEDGKRVNLVDVGIGCGDQSLRCLGYKRASSNEEGEGGKRRPLFDSYIGITSLPIQASFAKQRVETLLSSTRDQADEKETPRAQIYCANAALPSTWFDEIKSTLPIPIPNSNPEDNDSENWLLALDTLYHYTPSRTPLLRYTHDTLHANLASFDLILPTPTPTLFNRLLLRLLCLLAGIPYSNFLSEAEYISLLIDAGYDANKIVFRDISEHVFPGISTFVKQRAEEGRIFGLGKTGKFRGAGRLFSWWGRSGVVRGVIVIARI
ncbi:uncharacterized protein BDV14DRAFT_202090 [Aspergillus stella-maris]|uniref:uncharacterized protein n=1 Tax=Aspergillus stella-maris TaxID=1810926 RepID=UPI003CCD1F8B